MNDFWIIEQNPEKARQAETYHEFLDSIAPMGQIYRDTEWMNRAWQTFKRLGFLTYQVLQFPMATKISDIFQSARLLEHGKTERAKSQNEFFISGWNSNECCLSFHGGGKRSTKADGTRQHFGAKFYLTYAVPQPSVRGDSRTEMCGLPFEWRLSFEETHREDGVLIVLNCGKIIGNRWIALLDKGETPASLYSEADRAFITAEREADRKAWGGQ